MNFFSIYVSIFVSQGSSASVKKMAGTKSRGTELRERYLTSFRLSHFFLKGRSECSCVKRMGLARHASLRGLIFGYRVRTLLSSSNSMTFHDFFHDLFKLSKTLGLAVSFKNTKPLLVLEHFLPVKSSTDTNSGVHQNACCLRCLR